MTGATDGARAVTRDALIELHRVLDDTNDPADFLVATDLILDRPGSTLALHYDTGPAEGLQVAGSSGRDVENGPLVYQFVGVSDPANASDPRLWSYLALRTFRPYMEARWPLEPGDGWRRRVKARWIMINPTRVNLVRHGIARLWWATYLTHDPRCEHPLASATSDQFAYTRQLLEREDRFMGLLEREVGSAPKILRGMLEITANNSALRVEASFRRLLKEVTLMQGYRDIESLDEPELRSLLAELAI